MVAFPRAASAAGNHSFSDVSSDSLSLDSSSSNVFKNADKFCEMGLLVTW